MMRSELRHKGSSSGNGEDGMDSRCITKVELMEHRNL